MVKVYASMNGYQSWKDAQAVFNKVIAAGIDGLHFDLLDGTDQGFPDTTDVFAPANIAELVKPGMLATDNPDFPLDAHIYVDDVLGTMLTYLGAGVSRITIPFAHLDKDRKRLLDKMADNRTKQLNRQSNLKMGVSFSMEDYRNALELQVLQRVDYFHIVGSGPGYDYEPMSQGVMEIIKWIDQNRRFNPRMEIVVEGGITPENAKLLKRARADVLVLGRAFLEYSVHSGKYADFIRYIREN